MKIKRISENHAENQYLLPNDILVIPRDGQKAFWEATLPGLTGADGLAPAIRLVHLADGIGGGCGGF